MSQQNGTKVSDGEVIAFLGTYFETSDVRAIFLEAGREYIKNIPYSEGKGKCGSLEEGVNLYFRDYQSNSALPFYLRPVYEKILAEGEIKSKKGDECIAAA